MTFAADVKEKFHIFTQTFTWDRSSTHAGASTRERSRDRARARDKKFIHPSRRSIARSRRVVVVGGP
jgi:hypothetical protein